MTVDPKVHALCRLFAEDSFGTNPADSIVDRIASAAQQAIENEIDDIETEIAAAEASREQELLRRQRLT